MATKSKTECVKEELAKNPSPRPEEIKEIATRCGCKSSYVYKLLRKLPKPEPIGVPEAVEPVVKVEAEAEKEVPTIEVEEAKEKAEVVEGLAEKIEMGVLTEDDLTYVWQAVNELFPQKHQRPQKSMELLGKLWVKPANRLMEKYATENIDLYLALGGTVLVFAPSIVGMVREARAKKPEKKVSEEIVG